MSLVENILADYLFVDFSAEVISGEDQMYVDYPIRFATVEFQLMSTSLLSGVADRIRKDLGFAPMHPMDEYTDDLCDQDGWYDFYYGISDLDGGRGDSGIEFIVVNSGSPDNEERYSIELTDEEQEEMYKRIDTQCKKYLGSGCRELLDEAGCRMKEMEAYRDEP